MDSDNLDETYESDQEYIYEDDDEDEMENNQCEIEDEDNNNNNYNGNSNSLNESKDNLGISFSSHMKSISSSPTSHDGTSDLKRCSVGSYRSTHIQENTVLAIPDGEYIITQYASVIPRMKKLVAEVAGLLDLDTDSAQVLLQQFRWNKEKLLDSFFANTDKIMEDSGLDLYSNTLIAFKSSSPNKGDELKKSINQKFQCRICYDDADLNESFALGCEHTFCRPCYSEYLRMQIGDGPACILAHCPQHKCKQSVTKSVFQDLVDLESFEKYEVFSVRNYIETSKSMRYCPAANCDKVAVASGITTVKCECGNPFCFKCGEESHDPANCTQLGAWTLKCQNESETANWILANTKKCPACSTRIEKNQGCNHVTCKMCKHDFCWICMGNWSDHGQNTGGYYKCNRFESGKIPAENDNEQQKAKAELDRYLHYYKRYHAHDSSLKFATGQRDKADKIFLERQESQRFPWTDIQFLKQAEEQVIECRRILKYTYVLGFFLIDGTPIKQLFEHHQEMLEKNTERLHEYTEKPIELIDRTQVVNLTRVNEKFLAALLASMMNGSIIDESLDISSSDNNGNNNSDSEDKNIVIKVVKTKSKSKKDDPSSPRQTRSKKK